MKLICRSLLAAVPALMLIVAAGCAPDPRKDPNFNEASLKSPGSIKMEPLTRPKGAK